MTSVEREEVDERARDVPEGDVAATAPRRDGDPADLLGLDGCGDDGVAEHGLRGAEVRDGAADAVSEQLATREQEPEAGEQAHERKALPVRSVAGEETAPGMRDARRREREPGDEQPAVQPRQPPVEREQGQGRHGRA